MPTCLLNNEFSVSFPGLGIIDLAIKRTAVSFSLFGHEFAIYWYGIIIAVAFMLCIYLALKQASRFDLNADHVADVFLAVVPLSIIGARLYYVVFAWSNFSGNLLSVFDLRVGGLAFYGGVMGGIAGVIIVSRLHKIPLAKLIDYLAPLLPLGQAIGRWGNFFNQEAFGTNTTLPWGMISNGTKAYLETTGMGDPNLPVHPTFLYEFLGNLLIMIVLLYWRQNQKYPWQTTLWYFGLYGVLRYFVEGIRTDALMIGQSSWRISELLSALMVISATGLLVGLGQHNRKKRELIATLQEKDQDE